MQRVFKNIAISIDQSLMYSSYSYCSKTSIDLRFFIHVNILANQSTMPMNHKLSFFHFHFFVHCSTTTGLCNFGGASICTTFFLINTAKALTTKESFCQLDRPSQVFRRFVFLSSLMFMLSLSFNSCNKAWSWACFISTGVLIGLQIIFNPRVGTKGSVCQDTVEIVDTNYSCGQCGIMPFWSNQK